MTFKELISKVQTALKAEGADIIADGVVGPKSEAALANFEVELKLIPRSLPTEPPTEALESITGRISAANPHINKKMIEMATPWLLYDSKITNKSKLLLVDFSKPDSEERLHVIDMKSLKSESFKVAHGKNSDPNRDGMPDSFSNTPGSYKSSLGPVLIGSVFTNKKWKYVRLLDGLQKGLNDKIRAREILMHSSTYVNDTKGKPIGDTLGCFGLSEATARKIFPSIGGCLMYAWDDSLA